MFHIISLQTALNITGIRNNLSSTAKEKVLINLFLLTFFLLFAHFTGQKSFFNYHILKNNLRINYDCFVTKKSPNNMPPRKLSLKRKEDFKTRKEHVSMKHVLITRFFQISILQGCGRTMLPQRRSEAAVRRCFTK